MLYILCCTETMYSIIIANISPTIILIPSIVYKNIQSIDFEEHMVRGDAEDSYIISYVEDILPTEYKLSSA